MGQAESNTAASPHALERSDLSDVAQHFRLKYPNGFLTKSEFVEESLCHQGGSRELWEEISEHFCEEGTDRITFADFLAGLTSLTSGNTAEKLDWMFRLYDQDGNGVLDRNEVFHLVRGLMKAQCDSKKNVTDDEVRKKADALFSQMDADNNGSIDREEFVAVASRDEQMCNALASQVQDLVRIESQRDEFAAFENQVAGHSGGTLSMLKDASGKTIMKLMQPVEYNFYMHAEKNISERDLKIFPKFFGRKAVEVEGGVIAQYIVMEDLTAGMKRPNVMDLKMGFRGHDDNAKTLKVVQQIALCTLTTSSSLGFRLCGMRYLDDTGETVTRGKPWGAQLRKDTMPNALLEFVTQKGSIRFDVVEEFLRQLAPIQAFFETQRMYRFYSSSILFIYDALAPVGEPLVRVRLVDFGHTLTPEPQEKLDDRPLDVNFLAALRNLVKIWVEIRTLGAEVWENQRRIGSTWDSANLSRLERPHYSTESGDPPISVPSKDWTIDMKDGDDQGWRYASSWKGPYSAIQGKFHNVRRRRWKKEIERK